MKHRCLPCLLETQLNRFRSIWFRCLKSHPLNQSKPKQNNQNRNRSSRHQYKKS
ncbi:Uncharacterised protein [Vibrio cholerae]|nr:Uncharacterised protein [Vibrio cholerae]